MLRFILPCFSAPDNYESAHEIKDSMTEKYKTEWEKINKRLGLSSAAYYSEWYERSRTTYHLRQSGRIRCLFGEAFKQLLQSSVIEVKDLSVEMFDDLPKTITWFTLMIKLHLKGMPLTTKGLKSLGNVINRNEYGEQQIFTEIVDTLERNNPLTHHHHFLHFANWLIQFDIAAMPSLKPLLAVIPDWQKAMQADMVVKLNSYASPDPQSYDPNTDYPGCMDLTTYKQLVVLFKYQIIESLVQLGNKTTITELITSWIKSEKIRSQLFNTQFYPLNTTFDEYYPWNLLLSACPTLLNNKETELTHAFRTHLTKTDLDIQKEQLPISGHFVKVCGRTVMYKTEHHNQYYKFKTSHETPEAFRKGYLRLVEIDKQQKLRLQSVVPQPIQLMRLPELPETIKTAIQESASSDNYLFENIDNNCVMVMIFQTPTNIDYLSYVYDAKDNDSFMKGCCYYLHDYGVFFRHKILAPRNLTANHDQKDDRVHRMFPIYGQNYISEGSIERWNTEATDFPNIGIGDMGMRDKVDCMLPEEKPSNYFTSKDNPLYFSDTATSDVQAKIRIEELGKAFQGACLLYARYHRTTFDIENDNLLRNIEKDIEKFVISLFCSAFPLNQAHCHTLMYEDDLLPQLVRELVYWTAESATFVHDLRAAQINRKAYPNLPPRMQAGRLTEKQLQFLKAKGFTHSQQEPHRTSLQLGSATGRMPLITLNALTVKMITCGILAEANVQ